MYPPLGAATFDPVPRPNRLILFDIDGTLLTASGAPRRAFRRALIEHFGTDGDEAGTDFSGKTDPQIVYELMGGAGFDDDRIEERIAALFEHYLEGLELELEEKRTTACTPARRRPWRRLRTTREWSWAL